MNQTKSKPKLNKCVVCGQKTPNTETASGIYPPYKYIRCDQCLAQHAESLLAWDHIFDKHGKHPPKQIIRNFKGYYDKQYLDWNGIFDKYIMKEGIPPLRMKVSILEAGCY